MTDEEIQEAVTVIIDPRAARAEPASRHARLAGDLHKPRLPGRCPLVPEEVVAPQCRDEEILAPVVVVIARGAAYPIALERQSCWAGDVFERAVTAIAIEGW